MKLAYSIFPVLTQLSNGPFPYILVAGLLLVGLVLFLDKWFSDKKEMQTPKTPQLDERRKQIFAMTDAICRMHTDDNYNPDLSKFPYLQQSDFLLNQLEIIKIQR